jgi:hypothetical protein
MARHGWLDRLNPVNWLHNIVDAITGGKEEPVKPPRRAEPRPQPEPERERKPRERRERDPFERIWSEETLGRAGRSYRANREVFDSLPGMADENELEQRRLWRLYVRHMVMGHTRRNDVRANPFWRETGIHPDNFDWQEWREAMGYKHRKSA